MDSLSYIAQNLHWFVILLGSLIFFHELGHFLVAKACDVKVLRFSLGFGPRLLGFTRGETEYRVGLLPFGGYVKMLGEMGPDGTSSSVPEEDRSRAFSAKSVWQRIAIVAAGPAFNFVLAYVIYAAMFTGVRTFGDTRLGIVSAGDPAFQAGIRPGDRIVSIEGVDVTRWEELREQIAHRPGEPLKVTYERGPKRFTTIVEPESRKESNIFQEIETRGKIGVSLQYLKPTVAVVDPESPAADAGVQTDDTILTVNDQQVEAWHEVRQALAGSIDRAAVTLTLQRGEQEKTLTLKPTDFPPALEADTFSAANTADGYTGLVNKDTIVTEVEPDTPAQLAGLAPGDRLLRLGIKREGQTLEEPIEVWGIDLAAFSGVDARSQFVLTVQRGREVLKREFRLEEREEKDEFKNVRTRYVFGAKHDTEVVGTYVYERHVNVFESLALAARQLAEDTTVIAKGVALIAQRRLSLDNVGGPIMLFVIAEKSAKRGWDYFFRIMAMISVNLGLINLLPIPVLDGGHLMFLGVEAVRRRPPSMRFREIAQLVGFAILLLLMILVLRNDFLKYVLG